MFCTCSVHVLYMFCTCSVHVLYMFYTCSVHVSSKSLIILIESTKNYIYIYIYIQNGPFSSIFGNFRKIAKGDRQLWYVRPSVRPSAHPSTCKNVDPRWIDFEENWYFKIFYKLCKEILSFIEIGENDGYCAWSSIYIYISIGLHAKSYICIYIYIGLHVKTYIQGVPGGMCQTSGECSLC